MSRHQHEIDLQATRHLLTAIGFIKQLCGGSVYMTSYLNELSDRTLVQISLLQEILRRSEEFENARTRN